MSKNPITKVCAVCGLSKPLSAFLQLDDAQGVHYGNTCASCRKIATEDKSVESSDETTSSTSGKKIDHKAKVAGDLERREQWEATEEEYHRERDKQEKDKTDTALKKEKASYEKKKQDSFLRRPYASKDRSKVESKAEITQAQTAASNKFASIVEEADKKDQVTKEEQQKTETSLDTPYLDTGFGIKQKQGIAFNTLARIVGTGSPIGRAAAEMAKKAKQNPNAPQQSPEELLQENKSSKPGRRR